MTNVHQKHRVWLRDEDATGNAGWFRIYWKKSRAMEASGREGLIEHLLERVSSGCTAVWPVLRDHAQRED